MPSKLTIEAVLFALCAVVVFRGKVPDIRPLTRVFDAVARRPLVVGISCVLAVLAVRAALLPVWPFPRPSIYDEFSYLLQADTFAHGRLTNAPHPLWQFFESIYILQQPTYASKYPPGQALFMALGQWLLGHAWFGVWLSCGALTAALCWALAGWLRPRWTLLGTLIALDLCAFSYWMNSYWGGAVAGIGGALVIGAYARLVRRGLNRRGNAAWIFGIGAVMLLCTRPFEGFLLFAPTAGFLWVNCKRDRARIWAPIVILGAVGIAGNTFYDIRITGHLFRLPYQEYFAQYESVPPLIVMPVQPAKFVRHFDFQLLDELWAREKNNKARSLAMLPMRGADLLQMGSVFFGNPLWLVPFIAFAPGWVRSKRTRLPAALTAVLLAGAAIEFTFYPHYMAPFTAVLLILLVQSLRRMRIWAARNLPGGNAGGRFIVLAWCAVLLATTLGSETFRIYTGHTPDRSLAVNARKGIIETNLESRYPGGHVIFVRYTKRKNPHEEWIYNSAAIDAQPVVWAQDMGAENSKLVAYYPGRRFWIFQPDVDPDSLEPYH